MQQLERLLIAMVLTLDLGNRLCVVLGQPAAVVATLLFMALAGFWLRTALHEPPATPLPGPAAGLSRALLGLMLIQWLANALTCARPLLHLSPLQWLILGAGALVLGHALWRPTAASPLLLTMVVLGTMLRLVSFRALPIDPAYGDMLPLVKAALANLLAGRSPYVLYYMPWPLPLVYPPLTWLSYLLPYVLGLDIRLTNVVLELVIGAVLYRVARRPTAAVQLWAYLFLGEAMTGWSLNMTHLPFWCLAGLTLALVFVGRLGAAALVFGLCAASSPLSMVMAPFLLLFLFRNCSRRQVVGLCALTALVAIACYLPFLWWDSAGLVLGLWRWHNLREHIAYELWKLHHGNAELGLNGLFDRLGLYAAMKPLQATAIVALGILYYRRGATLRLLGPILIVALALFLGLNPIVHVYYYVIVPLIGLFTLATAERQAAT